MRSQSHSHNENRYSTVAWHDSHVMPGVRYGIRRISLAQRIELTSRARELTNRYEFLRAGDAADQLEASLADLLTRKLYLEWGLAEIRELTIDGQAATVEMVVEKAPEALSNEIVAAIQGELSLSEEERKNF
jgi:hypothetical protein